MIRKFRWALLAVCLVVALLVFQCANHPILLRWMVGSARSVGKPLDLSLYTNGQPNQNVKVFRVESYWDGAPAHQYVLYFPSGKFRNVIIVNMDYSFVASPSCTAVDCYDIVRGRLFQSEVGAHFSDYRGEKGYHFDPRLAVSPSGFNFILPPSQASELGCDSVRVKF